MGLAVFLAMGTDISSSMLMVLTGFGAGIAVAGGIFALIVGLKIVPRFAEITHTADHMMLYENCIIWGGIIGNAVNVYRIPVTAGVSGVIIFGLVGGIYVGAWAMALAEIVDVFPIFSRRFSLKRRFGLLILMLAAGRATGSLLHFYYRWG